MSRNVVTAFAVILTALAAVDIRAGYQTTAAFPKETLAAQADVAVRTEFAFSLAGQQVFHTRTRTVLVMVTNNGPATASNVQLSNVISNGTLVSATTSQGTCTGANCAIGAMSSGAVLTVSLDVNPNGAIGSTLSNVATVSNPESDPVSSNNTATVSGKILAAADVGVTASAALDPIYAGATQTYTIVTTNHGPDPAGQVSLHIADYGPTFLAFTGTGGASCTGGQGFQDCTIGPLASGAANTITMQARAPSYPPSQLYGVLQGNVDYNPGNDTFFIGNGITPISDLAVVKSGPSLAVPGSTITYTVKVTNYGPSEAPHTVVNDPTPTNLTFVSNSGDCVTAYPCVLQFLSDSVETKTITSTYTVAGNATGSITNTATVSATLIVGPPGPQADPNPANNTSSVTTMVNAASDVAVTKNGPSVVSSGASINYTIVVRNLSTIAANGVVLTDPTPARLTLTQVSGVCSTLPCNIGTLNGGQSVTAVTTYDISAATPGSVTNTATVTSTTNDTNMSNNTSSVTTQIGCTTTVPQLTFPGPNVTNVPTAGNFQWIGNGSAMYTVYLDVAGVGCTTTKPAGTTLSTQLSFSNLKPNTDYEWRVEGSTQGCLTTVSACGHFTTGTNCATAAPTPISPVNGATVASTVHFSWSAVSGAARYDLFVSSNGNPATNVATTTTTSADVDVVDGPGTWFVLATLPGCGQFQSAPAAFNTCNVPIAPVVSVVSNATSGQTYSVTWVAISGASKYDLDEATDAAFTSRTTQTITPGSTTPVSVSFTKSSPQSAQPFFYRVRAFLACGQIFGPYSTAVRIVITPVPPRDQKNPNINVPVGSTTKVMQQIFVPGQPEGSVNFSASIDQPFITIAPTSGLLPPSGITLTLTADPTNLSNGTWTGTITVTLTPTGATGRTTGEATAVVGVPVSVSVVTPLTPATRSSPAADSLIVPSVGHLDGIDSHWQSDVRVTNIGHSKQMYSLTFTPDDPSQDARMTQITVADGGTAALDDIVRNWYGYGEFGESANGVLEIHPASTDTIVSSRTYDVTSNGTLGQYVAAIPIENFIGHAAADAPAQALSLQQIAQSAAYRTNFGLVEAAGQPAGVVMSVFDTAGNRLKEIPVQIQPFQHLRLNQMLATNGISDLPDGRVEVRVASGDGRVTAYASVVDNGTGDPLLVSGARLDARSGRYVLAGVAALNNGFADWRTDMRIFNPSAAPQSVTLTFYPLGNPGTAVSRSAAIRPGEVTVLDDVARSTFGQSNVGGAVHVTTSSDSSLIVTGRTYDRTSAGTYGQFIQAVTPQDAAGAGSRPLQILQVEDSPRYRTNVGIAEVTGKAVTVVISVVLPESETPHTLLVDLAPNEYRQWALIPELGLGNVYNARVTVTVAGGEGKVIAYGSVIDRQTQDPTYIPAR